MAAGSCNSTTTLFCDSNVTQNACNQISAFQGFASAYLTAMSSNVASKGTTADQAGLTITAPPTTTTTVTGTVRSPTLARRATKLASDDDEFRRDEHYSNFSPRKPRLRFSEYLDRLQ